MLQTSPGVITLGRFFASASLAVSAISVTGCSAAPFDASADAQVIETPEVTMTAPIESIANDLATGSAVHALTAGDVSLAANYWSTLSMDKWTSSANKPISLSVVGSLGTDGGQSVYLSRMTIVTAVDGPLGPLATPPVFIDSASVAPGYLIKPPYSYSQTFVLPAVDSTATSVTFSLTYELLVQTTPGSPEFAKQTASDRVVVAITP